MALAALNMTVSPIAGAPPIINFVGITIPIAALFFGLLSLVLVRYVKPNVPSASEQTPLTPAQNRAVTGILAILLCVIITGEVPFLESEPLGVGMAVLWGIGLGTTGMLAIDLIGDWARTMMQRVFGRKDKP